MKRSIRSAAKRAGSPLLGPLDRRFAELADTLAETQRRELERLDERLEIDLRILDEHLLAIRRASHRMEQRSVLAATVLDAVEAAVADATPGLVLVAAPGTDVVLPSGFEAVGTTAFAPVTDGAWVHHEDGDDPSALRVVRLRQKA